MRKIAWALVVLLVLTSAALFVVYVGITASLGDPKFVREVRQIAAYAHLIPTQAAGLIGAIRAERVRADFALYLSIATGLLAVLSFVILAATHRRKTED